MPEKFPVSKQEKPKQKKEKEDLDLDFGDMASDLLDLAGELQEGIADGERIIEKYVKNNGKNKTPEDFSENVNEITAADRIKKLELLRTQRGKKENEEQKKAEQAEKQKKAELIVYKIFSSPALFKEIFKNKGKIDHEFLNNLIKIDFENKNKIENETEKDNLAVEVEVNQIPSLGNERQKEEFIEHVVDTAKEEYLKTLSNIENQSILSPDEQEYDVFVKLKLPQEIIPGLESFINTIETTGVITEKMTEKIQPLLDYFRRDIKFQASFSLSDAIEEYLSSNEKEELLKQYQDKQKNIFLRSIDKSYENKFNFLNIIKRYLENVSKEEKSDKKETILENRLIKNLISILENLIK